MMMIGCSRSTITHCNIFNGTLLQLKQSRVELSTNSHLHANTRKVEVMSMFCVDAKHVMHHSMLVD